MIPHAERLDNAVTAMLEELRAEQEREGALGCELIESRHRRRELLRSLTILIKTFPEADRRRHAKRLERVEALHRAPRRRPGASERSEAVLAFLAGYPGDEVRAAELGQALVEAGLDPGRGLRGAGAAPAGQAGAGGAGQAGPLPDQPPASRTGCAAAEGIGGGEIMGALTGVASGNVRSQTHTGRP